MIENKINALFKAYIAAFKQYDITRVANCYALPCLLSTPDKLLLINNEQQFTLEFDDIFSQLQQANTQAFKITQASYQKLDNHLYLVCIDWAFMNAHQEIFADFSAFYTLSLDNGMLQITQVISHTLEQSKTLTYSLETLVKEY